MTATNWTDVTATYDQRMRNVSRLREVFALLEAAGCPPPDEIGCAHLTWFWRGPPQQDRLPSPTASNLGAWVNLQPTGASWRTNFECSGLTFRTASAVGSPRMYGWDAIDVKDATQLADAVKTFVERLRKLPGYEK